MVRSVTYHLTFNSMEINWLSRTGDRKFLVLSLLAHWIRLSTPRLPAFNLIRSPGLDLSPTRTARKRLSHIGGQL